MTEEERPSKRTLGEVVIILQHMNDNLHRISRNQVLGALIFGLIVLIVLIQGQKISIKIPGILEVTSAEEGK